MKVGSSQSSGGPTRMLVIQPDPHGDLDRFAPWLEAQGVELEVVRPFEGEQIPSEPNSDGLIVLGGSMGAKDESEYPWLRTIKSLLRTAAASSVPTLGICLGAQLLAEAHGGEVLRGGGLESGVVDVSWLESARADPLVSGLHGHFQAGAMHFDEIVRLPPDAILLGTGTTYRHQAFRVGTAWGLQFHPEISPRRFRSWRREVPPSEHERFDRQAHAFERMDDQVRRATRELAQSFSRIVRDAAYRKPDAATDHTA